MERLKLGYLTVCMNIPLEAHVRFAASSGFQTLEVAAFKPQSERDFASSTINVIDFLKSPDKNAEKINTLLEANGLEISSLANYENLMHPTQGEAEQKYLKKVIEVAGYLGVRLVGTFIGSPQVLSMKEFEKEYQRVFLPLIEYAGGRDVRLMFENCPMVGWWGKEWRIPGNLFYCPELWDTIFKLTPSVGMNYDPSHLVWQGIDPVPAIRDYGDHIVHAHAKDAQMHPEKLQRYGVLGKPLDMELGYWTARVPGSGDIDWSEIVTAIKKYAPKCKVLSIELEDPDLPKEAKGIQKALSKGRDHLASCDKG